MKIRWFLTLIFAVATVAASSFFSSRSFGKEEKFRRSSDPIKGRYIVVLDDTALGYGATEPAVRGQADFLGSVYGGKVDAVYADALRGYSAEMTEKEAQALSDDYRVAFVEEDGVISVASSQSNAGWNLDRVDQRTMPLDTVYNYSTSGVGVHAYVIDTGVRWTHVDFGGRADAVYDGIGDGQNGNDCNGHGTHVAGTIGSSTYGVAKGVFIHSVRVLNCTGNGSISYLLSGINWVTANHQSPAVANISITAAGTSSALETGLTNSIASGVTYSVAAGNSGLDACNYTPARTPNALTVGATDGTDTRAGYSNNGPCVDVFAPGNAVLSLGIASDTATAWLSGTSMASPMVAGTAANYLQNHPTATAATISQLIKSTATSGVLTMNDTTSSNLLLYSPLTTGPAPTPTPTATPTPSPTPTPAAVVRVRKQVVNTSGTTTPTEFPYTATNLASSSFVLADNTDYVDPNVQVPGTATSIQVTEEVVSGWQLMDISCSEASGGPPSLPDSTVDVANHKANIIAEPGEQITCTFTSQPMSPTAGEVSVSGRLFNSSGTGVGGVTLSIVDVSSGGTTFARSNPFGYYVFDGLEAGRSYVLTAYPSRRFVIANNTRLFTLNDSVADVDFTIQSTTFW